jgi:ankyrin repeat protein
MTALMYVVKIKRKDFSLAKLLVENGADVNARDDYGIIIRKMAKGRKLKKYLKKNGAFRK